MQFFDLVQIKKQNNNTTNNNNNNCHNTNNNNSHNNITNYLNVNFSNVQPMEKFIENFKTKFPLTEADRLCLLNTYNECDIGLFSDTFFHMMKKYLLKQIDPDMLPTMPMVCNDSNLRSFKEFNKDGGWKSTQSNKCIDQMIDISNSQIYEVSNKMMCMDQKQRNKIYKRMKQENSLLSMEHDKNNYDNKKKRVDDKDDNSKDSKDNENELDKKSINGSKEMDFSIINDNLIEKYSLPDAPKLIT